MSMVLCLIAMICLAQAAIFAVSPHISGFAGQRIGLATPPPRQESGGGTRLPFHTHPDDDLTRSAFSLFYNMHYDAAVAKFRAEMQARPDDPFVVNHLLAAILGKELNREGAFDAALYTGDRFLKIKPAPVDPAIKAEILNLAGKSQALATAQLQKDPNNADALYARAAARSYEALFYAVVEKHWLAALRHSLGSFHDDEQVLKLDPKYSDAKFVVGSVLYVVGNLSWYERMIAFVVSLHGNKKEGIQLLREAANGGGETSMDARMLLSLFLARERQYDEPIALMRRSYFEFPGNFIYGYSEAELLAASGQRNEAVATFCKLIPSGERNQFPDARAESAALSLGELFRKEKNYKNAAGAFDDAAKFPHPNGAIVVHCDLEAGEMYDLLGQRQMALERYGAVIALAPNSDDAGAAERYLEHAFKGGE